jgi:hypothetical protein
MTVTFAEPASQDARNLYEPGVVVLPCHDQARYHQFTHDMQVLDVPDGTIVSYQRSASVVQNLNEAVKEMLAGEAAWAWFIADDHAIPRDIVLNLLALDLDITVPLVCRRGPPYSLVVFDEERGEDEYGRTMYHVLQYDDLPEDGGVIEVVAAGSAGMLVKREVFEAMGDYPWFSNSDGFTCNEDVEFCKRARALGYQIYCDTDSRLGHIGNVALWPGHREGRWGIVFDFEGSGQNQIWMPGGVQLNENQATTAQGQVDW